MDKTLDPTPDPLAETAHYLRDGYVAIERLFPVEVLRAFYDRMRSDLGAGGQSMRRFAAQGPLLSREAIEVYGYQYPPMLGLLWGLTPRIALATGCDLLPTYAYFRLYQQGDICRVHSDRLACEHSLSLTIGYGEGKPWALSVARARVDVPTPTVADDFEGGAFGSVAMQPGDGVLYQGVHYRHGRLEPNPNSWSAHLFLHWIDRNGPYKEQAFDAPAIAAAGNQAG